MYVSLRKVTAFFGNGQKIAYGRQSGMSTLMVRRAPSALEEPTMTS